MLAAADQTICAGSNYGGKIIQGQLGMNWDQSFNSNKKKVEL